LYDATQLTLEIEDVISKLSETIGRIQVTKGFSKVLKQEQLEGVYCAALKLCTAVTEYLAKAIIYLEDQSLGIIHSEIPLM
jgi:hypothetical protein